MKLRQALLIPVLVIPALMIPETVGAQPDEAAHRAWGRVAGAHYERVENELRRADVSHLTPAQRRGRERVIDAFRDYRVRGVFGENTDFPGSRKPYFVDREGRRCAVAHLLHATGEDALVERVRRTDNHAWVPDLADDAALVRWLDGVGLTLAEAVRIQVPSFTRRQFRRPSVDPTLPGGADIGGTPGGNAPGRGATSAPGGTGGGTGGGSGGGTSGLGGSGVPTASGSAPVAGGGAAQSWWMWWEVNKLEYIRPNRRSVREDVTAARALLRGRLASGDAVVRAAAVVALGRVEGHTSAEALIPLLVDPNVEVRERALLGLGASGSPVAAETLLHVARTGRAPGRNRDALSADARPLAIVALGVGRRYGMDASIDGEIQRIVKARKRRERGPIGAAALLYQILSRDAGLDAAVRKMGGKSTEPASVRTRAVERLGTFDGKSTLRLLEDHLTGPNVELRRSAAIALARFDDPLVLPRIQSAYELESEPLTRGFLLLSIGVRGGDEARAYLLEELRNGPPSLRPWAALSLGVLARDQSDTAVREALRNAARTEEDDSARGAYVLAAGLTRDAAALPALESALSTEGAPMTRMYAATALGLVGGPRARMALLERVRAEKSELVRTAVAQSLGALGEDDDVDFVLHIARNLNDPMLRGLTAVALGFHGSDRAVEGALRIGADDSAGPGARAAAIEAVGLLLGRRPGLELAELGRESNFAAFPAWLANVLQSTL